MAQTHGRHWSILLGLCLGLSWACAGCEDAGGGDGGAAGMPAVTPTVGEACITSCGSGVVCGRAGPLSGVCTADCSNDSGCASMKPKAICVGAPHNKCALTCSSTGDCPSGTACAMLAGRMACTATSLNQSTP